MVTAVYDANVLASGFVSASGARGRILDAWRAGQLTLVLSEHILAELVQTLQKPYFRARLSSDLIARFLSSLREDAVVAPLTAEVQGVAPHAADDPVLATALSGDADYLVTGDRPLRRRLPTYRGIQLVSPAEFVGILEAQ